KPHTRAGRGKSMVSPTFFLVWRRGGPGKPATVSKSPRRRHKKKRGPPRRAQHPKEILACVAARRVPCLARARPVSESAVVGGFAVAGDVQALALFFFGHAQADQQVDDLVGH